MIRPPSESGPIMADAAAWVPLKVPRKLTRIIRAMSSIEVSRRGSQDRDPGIVDPDIDPARAQRSPPWPGGLLWLDPRHLPAPAGRGRRRGRARRRSPQLRPCWSSSRPRGRSSCGPAPARCHAPDPFLRRSPRPPCEPRPVTPTPPIGRERGAGGRIGSAAPGAIGSQERPGPRPPRSTRRELHALARSGPADASRRPGDESEFTLPAPGQGLVRRSSPVRASISWTGSYCRPSSQ